MIQSLSKLSMTNNLEFLDDIHTYLYKGKIIPSVTQLLDIKFPSTYSKIPDNVLNSKANYGTKVHHYVEQVLMGNMTLEEVDKLHIDPNIKYSCHDAVELSKKWMFDYESSEEKITYKGKYGGMYDLKTIDGYIIDIKTTYELHVDNDNLENLLNYQISGYYLASKEYKDKGYCLWLPKGHKGSVHEVKTLPKDVCKKEFERLIKEYEHNQQ